MSLIADIKSLEPSQRSAIWASYLGWTLDAFDFFLLVFLKVAIGKQFGISDAAVSELLFLTLAARPFGAFFFGWLADRFGRRPKRSPSQPKQKAPIGRAASVRKTPCATAFTSVPNSFEIAESMKTMRKKSKASSVQPR